MDKQTEWFNTKEAARRLGMSTGNLYALLKRGTVKSVRIGGCGFHRFNQKMIDAYLQPSQVRENHNDQS